MSRKTALSPPAAPSPPPPGKPPAAESVRRPRRRAPGAAKRADLARDLPERDILDQYLHEVARTPLLTVAEEREVAQRARTGDEAAIAELVTRNLRFVISVAKKYQNRGLSLIDLIGEGNIGLMTAARKFDPDQGVKFISYAVWWVRQSILASLARDARTVRLPLNRTADLARLVRSAAQLRQELGREPTHDEIAAATGLTRETVLSLAALNVAALRLDAPIDAEGDRSLIDRFTQDESPDVEAEVLQRLLGEEVSRALRTLPPREARVLILYFGLEEGDEFTLEEIGAMLGVTRERARQIRDRAIRRIREGECGGALRSFAAD